MGRPQLESDVLISCKQLLTLLQNEGRLIFKRISTTGIPVAKRAGGTFFAKNAAEGFADLFIALPGGASLHCELKSAKGRLSAAQEAWKAQLEAFQHHYYVIRSVRDLEQALRKHGVVHWSFGGAF